MSDGFIDRDALPSGTRVGKYELLDVLGRGGFGITYLGWDTDLGITVAIKEYMPVDIAERDEDGNLYPKTEGKAGDYDWGYDKFLEEANELARFRHPAIVQVEALVETHGTAYIVMEHVKGQTLFSLFEAERTLSEDRLRYLITPILSGLRLVHAEGTWHCDIKPGNIMIRDDGTPVLIDFGAAQVATAEHSRLVQAVVMPGFSPFEQYGNSRRLLGPWTDIYAIGAVLYRGMTGIVPIDSPSRVERDDLVPVSRASKTTYSQPLTDAVDWALRVRRTERPQSVDEWRDVLEGRTARPGDGPNPPKDEPGSKGDRSWILWILAPLAAVVLATGIFYLVELGKEWVQKGDAGQILVPVPESESESESEPEPEPESESEPEESGPDLSQLLKECQEFNTKGHAIEALKCYRKVLELAPGHPDARKQVPIIEMLVEWDQTDALEAVEAYYAFEQKHKPRVTDRGELGKLAATLVKLARTKMNGLQDEYWESVKADGTRKAYEDYRKYFPKGTYAGEADRWLATHR